MHGTARLVGVAGEVLEFSGGLGWAHVEGERWQVRAAAPLQPGQAVRVTRVDGLMLEVSPISSSHDTQGVPP